ncbi:MAG: DNA replication/repair protein RecF [Sphingobium sp.]|jgi:DNA replication and repair protein RecF|uniref:DNA replication/repair protein RecF n=1 Tax=Sphingobium sp. TaxID=1912891 RepID=UPI000C59AF11|nr:DNA replication/repair protein RecF [Sphingobium sp.]MBU0659051.1 DNA replication/repair protein RecF [Alphaproteobacteria bacterium]MBA4753220.1 DNA replication/repair protein RecF [Sphingobium sp.]MBS88608.1 DNA replication/repair protein RecF [Sphingobium sp.]MBU0869247.1 DNA replication/repair protein RecF [Alphaproteobacteria bacterium]MBU1259406.1 DNA replication/repair protein RecF [Alphaproteobacteria bacterium]
MIGRLTLSDFRNHADALIVPDHGFILLTGDNGAGKTNILEAVSMLAPGRGLRGAALRAMARQDGPGGFGIAAEVDGVVLGTGVVAATPDRRQVRIGGVASSANALADHLSIVWLTPAMDRLFLDSPGGRRRFLDRLTLALHPAHAAHSARYDAAMRARNRLLTDQRRADPAWLAALEAQMGEHGVALAAARSDLVARLNLALAGQPDAPFARPMIAIESEEDGSDLPLAERLARERRRDAAAGRTLSGPHRHDLSVLHIAKGQPAALCSTGEQKALLLSILLAHATLVAAHRGQPPVLLLDEVAAHLDPSRRAALFDRLEHTGGQVWMTGTESSLFNELSSATRLTVTAGHVFRSAI